LFVWLLSSPPAAAAARSPPHPLPLPPQPPTKKHPNTNSAVGWHLHREAARLDAEAAQWKRAADELGAAVEAKAREAAGAEQRVAAAEAAVVRVSADLARAERGLEAGQERLREAERGAQAAQAELERARRDAEDAAQRAQAAERATEQAQAYGATLQGYNTSLTSDLVAEKAAREELAREREALQARAAELGGLLSSQERVLEMEREAARRARAEREQAAGDAARLGSELESARAAAQRAGEEAEALREELRALRSARDEGQDALQAAAGERAALEARLKKQAAELSAARQERDALKRDAAAAAAEQTSRGADASEMEARIAALQEAVADAERRVLEGDLLRRKMHNTIMELKGNIRVFCRVRPPSSAEEEQAAAAQQAAPASGKAGGVGGSRAVVGKKPAAAGGKRGAAAAGGTYEYEEEEEQEGDGDGGDGNNNSALLATSFPVTGELLGRGLEIVVPGNLTNQPPQRHSFAFDRVFGPQSGQEQVFEEIGELVQSALDGHKVCIFAYGQTGSGKTHTMVGDSAKPGIIPRAMRQIFDSSRRLTEAHGWEFSMQASMLEIYNEEYRDLLAAGGGGGGGAAAGGKRGGGKAEAAASSQPPPSLKVTHDASTGATHVSDLTLLDVQTPEDVEALLRRAMERRAVGCTQLNAQSSRSHAVFSLRIDGKCARQRLRASGALHLVDLAGSERVKESGAEGARLKEAQAINKSLSALGDVIFALASKQEHVPFRNSKLTWLLAPALGGGGKTLMFVNVAPTARHASESLCSLRFAAKVNACEVGRGKRDVRAIGG
jgi:kinesin family protein C1